MNKYLIPIICLLITSVAVALAIYFALKPHPCVCAPKNLYYIRSVATGNYLSVSGDMTADRSKAAKFLADLSQSSGDLVPEVVGLILQYTLSPDKSIAVLNQYGYVATVFDVSTGKIVPQGIAIPNALIDARFQVKFEAI